MMVCHKILASDMNMTALGKKVKGRNSFQMVLDMYTDCNKMAIRIHRLVTDRCKNCWVCNSPFHYRLAKDKHTMVTGMNMIRLVLDKNSLASNKLVSHSNHLECSNTACN